MPPPRCRISRDIEWIDTDASGLYHYATAFRLAEAAEAALMRTLGVSEATFGHAPRVRVEADFKAPLRFGDRVDVDLGVERVGRSSATYRFVISCGDTVAVQGSIVTAFIDDEGRAQSWPEPLRRILEGQPPAPESHG